MKKKKIVRLSNEKPPLYPRLGSKQKTFYQLLSNLSDKNSVCSLKNHGHEKTLNEKKNCTPF